MNEPSSFLSRLEPLCALPLRAPRLALALILGLSALVGAGAFQLRFDPSTEKVFPAGHPAVADFAAFREAFGADEAVFVALEVPAGHSVYEAEPLALARHLARQAAKIEGVERAVTLADLPLLALTPFGPALVPGLPEDPASASPEALRRWRAGVREAPLIEGTLVSRDERATSVVVRLQRLPPGAEGAALNAKVVRDLDRVVAEARSLHPEVRFYVAGSPMIKERIMRAVQEDMVRFAPPLVVIALLVSALILRSIRGPLLVVGVLTITTALTLGGMGWAGQPLDPMTALVPTLILVIGVADSLHLLVEQRAQVAALGPQASGAETILAACRHTLVPCVLTSATTVIGFGSLVTSSIPPIQRFGAAAAVAASIAFLVTFLFVPAVSALLPPPRAAAAVQDRAEGLARLVIGHPRLLLGLSLLFCGALSLGMLRMEAETDFLNFFPKDDPLVLAVDAIEARFSGVAPCEVMVQGPADCAHDPQVLRAIVAFERELEQHPLVDMAYSAADVVAQANRLVTASETPSVPSDAAGLQQVERLLEQLAGGRLETAQFISPAGPSHPTEEWLRVSVRARSSGSSKSKQLADHVRVLAERHLTPVGVRAVPTGTSVVFGESADTIVEGQIWSFLFAFLMITTVMTLALRSLRLGVLSAIPNLAPIGCLLGAMGYLGIHFNSFNSMVASIALGIAVDDTIHVLVGFRRRADERTLEEAVRETLAREGTALISTSAVLFAGFAVLLLGTFGPTREFGLLTSIAIAVALLGDLVILPGLLLLFPGLLGGALCGRGTSSAAPPEDLADPSASL